MSKKRFKASTWLQPSDHMQGPKREFGHVGLSSALGSGAVQEESFLEDIFKPNKFLTPGWTGEGLISKSAVQVKKSLTDFFEDSRIQFQALKTANRSRKQEIYELFLSYAHNKGITCHEIDKPSAFWSEIGNPYSAHLDILEEFQRIFCFRSVITYLYKLKFILSLSEATQIPFTEKNFLSPSNFLSKIFRKGSSRELRAECLSLNVYGWYRPKTISDFHKLQSALVSLSVTEMMKICTYRENLMVHKDIESNSQPEFSHSISHKDFGLFLNKVLIEFPDWLDSKKFKREKNFEVLNTKFCGDQLVSLSQSHWLAQETNLNSDWKEILCPDFQGDDFSDGLFHRICHELQALSFLVKVAKIKDAHPIEFICQVFSKKSCKNVDNSIGQISLFADPEPVEKRLYDRIILNLLNQPKKNPHHFLVTKIYQEVGNLSEEGFVYVFSNQKLFVPSQVSRVKQLLEEFQLVSVMHLEGLKGKGEIPAFLYVLRKRRRKLPVFEQSKFADQSRKEPCFSFSFNGELSQFRYFELITKELDSFFKNKSLNTLVFQSECLNNLSFDFHQDAVLNGQLLHSSNKDSQNITHPQFFRNLTKTCLPFENLFQVEEIANSLSNANTKAGLLFEEKKIENAYRAVLIVNQTSPESTELELIPSSSYRAKFEKYGSAFFSYFGLIPKQRDINYNLIREFFQSRLGNQIIQMTFNGGLTKVKGKIIGLLMPKFLFEPEYLPQHYGSVLEGLKQGPDSLLSMHPNALNALKEACNSTQPLLNDFAWHILGEISSLKTNVEQTLNRLKSENQTNDVVTGYENPLFLEEILNLEKVPLYPRHDDIYVEINVTSKEQIYLPLSKVEVIKEENGSKLLLWSNKTLVSTFHGEHMLLQFVEYILQNGKGYKIGQILQSLKVPKASELKSTFRKYDLLESALSELHAHLKNFICTTITSKINSNF